MNWSADDVAEVPPAVTTVTSTVPEPAGLVAVICVAESTENRRRRAAEIDRRGVRQIRARDRHRRAAGRQARASG